MKKYFFIMVPLIIFIGVWFYFNKNIDRTIVVNERQDLTGLEFYGLNKNQTKDFVINKNQTYIMIIWSYNCPACLKEMRDLYQSKFKVLEKFNIYLVNVNTEKKEELKIINRRLGFKSFIYCPKDIKNFTFKTDIYAVPMTIVVKGGKIVKRIVGYDSEGLIDLEKLIKRYLK